MTMKPRPMDTPKSAPAREDEVRLALVTKVASAIAHQLQAMEPMKQPKAVASRVSSSSTCQV